MPSKVTKAFRDFDEADLASQFDGLLTS